MASIFDKVRQTVSNLKTKAQTGIQNWAQTNPQQATRIINAPRQIAQTYQRVAPYVPFAPKIITPQIQQQNYQTQVKPFVQQFSGLYTGLTEPNRPLTSRTTFGEQAGRGIAMLPPSITFGVPQLAGKIPRAINWLSRTAKEIPTYTAVSQGAEDVTRKSPLGKVPHAPEVAGFVAPFFLGGVSPKTKGALVKGSVGQKGKFQVILLKKGKQIIKSTHDSYDNAIKAVERIPRGGGGYISIRNITPEGFKMGLVENKPPVEGGVGGGGVPVERAKVENFIKELPEVKKKVNLIDYIRTPSKVLEKIGLKNEAVVLDKAHFNYEQQLKSEVLKISKWYEQAPDPQSAVNIFKHLDGQPVQLAPNELKVANEIRPYLEEWANKLGLPKDKRIASYITHIFEKGIIEKEFDPEIAKIIANKVPGSVYDPFLEKRLGTMGYKENVWEALEAYVKRATRKVNMDPALKKLSKAADSLDLESYNYVKKLGDRINLRPTEIDNLVDNLIKSSPIGYKLGQRPTNLITSKFRQMIYRATLGLNVSSSMKNLTQGANTFGELGGKYTAKGYFDLAKKGTKELVDNGILNDAIIQDKDIHVMKKFMSKVDDGLFALFDFAEKVNRGSAYYGAKAKGLSQGMNEQQAIDYAREIVAKTQFKFSNIDTPLALSSDIAKTLLQFQSFSLKQTEYLAGKIKAKEWGGLLRYTAASLAMISTVGKLFGMRVQDLIPSLRFESPLTNLTETAGELISTDEDTRAKGKRDLLKQGKLLVPAGVQVEKTYTGLKTVGQGYSESPTGKYEYPVEKNAGQTIRAGVFGKYNLPEAREYYKEGRKPLSENQANRAKAFGKDQYYKELGGRYKDDAINFMLNNQKDKANELVKKYNIKITKKDFDNAAKKEVIPAILDGDNNKVKELYDKYGTKITFKDVQPEAKKRAIKALLENNKEEANKLIKEYKLKITYKDVYGQ